MSGKSVQDSTTIVETWQSSVDNAVEQGDNYGEACRRLVDRLHELDPPSSDSQKFYSRLDRSLPTLATLESKMKLASATLRSLKSVAALKGPVRYLPTNVIRRIFVIGSTAPLNRPPMLSALSHFSLLVSQVCCHWRAVALQLPSMWSYLYFGSTQSQLRSTKLFIGRSGKSPLHVFFRSPSRGAFWPALKSHARWSSVYISIDDYKDYDIVEELLRKVQKLPRNNLLGTLVMHRTGDVDAREHDPTRFLKYIARFRTLDLSSIGAEWYPAVLPKLIVLRLNGYHFYPNALLRALRSCPLLEELSLYGGGYGSEDPYPSCTEDLIVLQHLTILRLQLLNKASIAFCKLVRAPNLGSLALDSSCHLFLNHIIEFIQYSPFVTSLEIS
jgi:hypothetical protein